MFYLLYVLTVDSKGQIILKIFDLTELRKDRALVYTF